MTAETFDTVLVGAGSAGCALAARLSEDPNRRVLLLEAGPRDWNPLVRLPIGELATIGSSLDWRFETMPEPHLDGRRVSVPRGRVLGGSSAINGQIYVRGQRADFDGWAAAGCDGWDFESLLPLFRRSESWVGGASALRGGDGPLMTRFGADRGPLHQAFLAAGRALGHDVMEDYNQPDPRGFAWTQYTQTHGRPWRCSAAHAYLAPAKSRPNLTVRTGWPVASLVIERGRCVGVDCGRHGRISAATTVLCAGAYQSPQLLLLSGIGPADELAALGIKPVLDLPGVGRNLQDHAGGLVQHRCLRPVTYHALRRPWAFLRAGWDWAVGHGGPLSVFPMATMAFLASQGPGARPDLQFLMFPVSYDFARGRYATVSAYAVTWCVLRPQARGAVTLASTDPLAAPRIRHDYLGHPEDAVLNLVGLRMAREIHAQAVFDPFRGEELDPGAGVQDDAALGAYLRRATVSNYHPAGSCRMGTGPDAVVDPALRVHGIEGLRVADASIMPTVTSGNTNAPSIVIGEKAAELLR